MKNIYALFFLMLTISINAQLIVKPTGFNSIAAEKPDKTNEKFIELAKSWAATYNRTVEFPYEIYNVTATSFEIDAHKPNAFYYRNRGEAYYHRVKYNMKITLDEQTYKVDFAVKEIYTSNVLTEMNLSTFYAPDGRVKQEYIDAIPSLEKSANAIVRSFVDYMSTY